MVHLAGGFARFDRVVGWVAWPLLGLSVLVLLTQVVGWTGNRWVAAAQAGTPYLLALSMPIAAVGLVTQRWSILAVGLAVAASFVVLAWPLLFPPAQPTPHAGTSELRVFHGNLYYRNGHDGNLVRAIAHVDADVLVFTEYTPGHARALLASPVADRFPYRVGAPRPEAAGTAVWSRYPLTEVPTSPRLARSDSMLVLVASPTPTLVHAVHPVSPMVDVAGWRADLAALTDWRPPADAPAVVIGDFNATFWHPAFRDLLAAGWRDAHQAVGRGFSASFPAAGWPLPPVVRLDHALVDDRLAVTAVADVELPGSDHLGLVVTVRAA